MMAQNLMDQQQQHFYCVHKKGVEVLMNVAETKVRPNGHNPLIIVVFECPNCHHQLLYKISGEAIKQFTALKSKNPLAR